MEKSQNIGTKSAFTPNVNYPYIYMCVCASWPMCIIINFLNKQISFAFNAVMS